MESCFFFPITKAAGEWVEAGVQLLIFLVVRSVLGTSTPFLHFISFSLLSQDVTPVDSFYFNTALFTFLHMPILYNSVIFMHVFERVSQAVISELLL